MESVDEIYRKYAKNVYRYLLSICHDPDIAEDVTQEVFYQAVRNIDRYDGSCRITTWLCAIARNQLITYRRKHPVTDPLEAVDDEGDTMSLMDRVCAEESAEQTVIDSMGRMDLLKQLHLLREPFREVLYLRSFGSLSFREIGEVFGKTENWARVTFYRGKEKLRKEIEKNEV